MPTSLKAFQNEMRRLSPLAGSAATTTAQWLGLMQNGNTIRPDSLLEFMALNPSAVTVVAGFLLCPYLVVLKSVDDMVSFTDFSEEAQDADVTTDVPISSISTLALGDALYIGSHLPFRGVAVDLEEKNDTASVLLVEFFDPAIPGWVTLSATDGTDVAGDTMKQDGNVTWTIPAAWAKVRLDNKFANTQVSLESDKVAAQAAIGFDIAATPLFWTRWSFSVALDSSTNIASLSAMNRSTAYQGLVPLGQTHTRHATLGLGGYGSLEFITSVGTANLVLNAGNGEGEF